MTENFKRIFISYSIKDKILAEEIKKNLEENKFKVFLAHETVNLSEIWMNRILQEIKSCDFFLPIRTENYTQQVFPEQECGIALGHEKCIIPLILDTDPRHYGFLHFRQGYFFDKKDTKKSCEELSRKLNNLKEGKINMPKTREDIKILLLQFRLAKEMREQELRGYIKFSKLKSEQIVPCYILENDFNAENLENFDAVIVGGTGDFGVYEVRDKYPHVYEQLKQIAYKARELKMPVLNVCMQFWAVLFGGEIKTDESRQEVGAFTIKLTKEAKNDSLFCDMPQEFKAQVGHKDYVSKLPENAVLLAYSDLCPAHAYKIGNKEYAMQFHPELDKQGYLERVNFYRSYAPSDPEEFDKLIKSAEESPESVKLMERFVDRVILSQ